MVNGEQRRRPAVAAAVALLAVAGLAVAGSPGRLHADDPGVWVAVLAGVAALALLVRALVSLMLAHAPAVRPVTRAAPRPRPALWPVLLALLITAVVVTLATLLPHHPYRTLPSVQHPPPTRAVPSATPRSGGGADIGPVVLVLAGLALAVVLVAVLVARLRDRGQVVAPEQPVRLADDPLAAAVDAALLDLESEPDPRRAVIKAYARTESVLRERGVPRHPAEAPLEFLDRVLRELGGQAAVVDRLTVLFELAAFSPQPVTGATRDEAVAAFHALRAGLAEPTAATP